jgi:SM-20-related protein
MTQISNKIFCDDFLIDLEFQNKLLPNPYYDYPYLIIKNFLPENLCNEIVKVIQHNNDATEAKIRQKNDLFLEETLNKQIRKTKIYELSQSYKELYEASFYQHQKEIEDFFSVALTTSTPIQVLEYTQGSFYKAHSDDSNVLLKENQIVGFVNVAPQRKVTSVLFMTSRSEEDVSNNSFNGGELVFNYLYDENKENITFKPQAGDMILFLSNPIFTHEVKEVKSGYRLTLVQWHDAIVK